MISHRALREELVEPKSQSHQPRSEERRVGKEIQSQTEVDSTTERPRHKTAQHQPAFREGSKAAQVLTLLCRPEGSTLNEIRNQTGWQAHTVRGFISRNLSKRSRKVRSFERDGERVYRLKV